MTTKTLLTLMALLAPSFGAAIGLSSRLAARITDNIDSTSDFRLGSALAAGIIDNRSGAVSLIIGTPGARVDGQPQAGEVQFRRASGGNLFALRFARNRGVNAETGERFGSAVAVGDFTGDGDDDLVVGAPGGDAGGDADSGRIYVYNNTVGLTTVPIEFTQSSPGVPGGPEVGDQFGAALAVGDFNGDGRDDLAVGIPGEDLGAITDCGAIQIFLGSATGLVGSSFLSQDSFSSLAIADENDDRLGRVLSTGDFDGDGFDDLAIGVPDEDLSGAGADSGMVIVAFGGNSSAFFTRALLLTQETPGIIESSEPLDRFGAALVAADFGTDGRIDLAIGMPGQDFLAGDKAGAVVVLRSNNTGPIGTGSRQIDLSIPGVPGAQQANALFGLSLTAGDFNGDALVDLAIGSETDLGALNATGAVHVFYSGGSGAFASLRGELWHQNRLAGSDAAQSLDRFGAVLIGADFDGDNHAELAIGTPLEDREASGQLPFAADAGSVEVMRGVRFADGFEQLD